MCMTYHLPQHNYNVNQDCFSRCYPTPWNKFNTSDLDTSLKKDTVWLIFQLLTLSAPTPQNGQTHSNIRRLLPTNCSSVFDHFVGLALKELKYIPCVNYPTSIFLFKVNAGYVKTKREINSEMTSFWCLYY